MDETAMHKDLIQFGFERARRVLRVLVVDDLHDQAMFLGLIIKRIGHTVRLEHTSAEALERAAEFEPHVVFLDIGLPDIDGYELCRMMRQTTWGEQALIFAVTGRSGPEDIERSRLAGFDRHVAKPMEFKILRELLKHSEGNAQTDGPSDTVNDD